VAIRVVRQHTTTESKRPTKISLVRSSTMPSLSIAPSRTTRKASPGSNSTQTVHVMKSQKRKVYSRKNRKTRKSQRKKKKAVRKRRRKQKKRRSQRKWTLMLERKCQQYW